MFCVLNLFPCSARSQDIIVPLMSVSEVAIISWFSERKWVNIITQLQVA